MLKTNLKSIVNAKESLKILSETELPVKVSYSLAKLINEVNKELSIFSAEKLKLFKKYGKLENDAYTILSENRENFHADLESLLSEEVTVFANKIDLPEDLKLKPKDMINLEPFVTIKMD